MIRAAFCALGSVVIWSGVTMADVAYAAHHLAVVDRVAIGVGGVGAVLVGMELLVQAWRDR